MSDERQVTHFDAAAEEAAQQGAVQAPPKAESNEEERVPIAHVAKLRKQNAQLERRLSEFENADVERQKAALSETERLQRERDELLKEKEMLAETLQHRDRAALVRAAALKAKFADPDDAVAFADLSGIEDRDDAERHVKSLAKHKPHLLAAERAPAGIQKVTNGIISGDEQGPVRTEHDARMQEGRAILDVIEKAQARVGA